MIDTRLVMNCEKPARHLRSAQNSELRNYHGLENVMFSIIVELQAIRELLSRSQERQE